MSERKVSDHLEDALRVILDDPENPRGVITGFVVVAVQQAWGPDGATLTSYRTFEKHEQPLYHSMGLLQAAMLHTQREFLSLGGPR